MNWKKFIFIALVAGGFAFASASRSDAGVSVGIGIGYPGYGYYPYGYGYYPYGYYRPYYRPVVYVGPRWYWHNGHRVYFSRHHRWH